LAARLYDCRDTARRLSGDKYQQRIAEYSEYVAKAADVSGMSFESAAVDLAKRAQREQWL